MELNELTDIIVGKLQKNGFPEKKVSFPVKQLDVFMEKHGFDQAAVLEELAENDITSQVRGDRYLFSASPLSEERISSGPENPWDALKDKDPAKIKEEALAMMNKMSPEERKSIEDRIKNMSPEERNKLMDMARSFGL